MSQILANVNTNQHYTNDFKTERTQKVVVVGPKEIPQTHLFNDIDANDRFENVNNEIKSDSEKVKNKTGVRFFTFFIAAVLTVLGALGIKRIFK